MTEGEAFNIFVDYLRQERSGATIGLHKVISEYLFTHEQDTVRAGNKDSRLNELSSVFLAAAWDLALIGVLRPGIPRLPDFGTFDGSSYVFTSFGEQWIASGEEAAYVPLSPDAFAVLVSEFSEFGPAFQQRAREAALCFRARAFLACCSMAGAAAESVLLASAVALGNEADSVMKIYNSKGGRSKLETRVTGNLRAALRNALSPLFTLAKYWRDEASHGSASTITQPEARTALVTLYLYARIVHDHWQEMLDSGA